MKNRNLTEGPILGAIIALAIPVVIANLLQTAYQLIDTFWVGRLGADAVAAVSLNFPINFLLIALGGGFAISGSILVAYYKGKRDADAVNHVAAQTLIMMFAVSVLLTVLGYFLAEPIMRFMGADATVLPQAVAFMKIISLGTIFTFMFFMYQSLVRGVGDVKTPIYLVLATVVLNAILNPLFILGWGPVPAMGVAGAALSTVICQGVAALIGISMLFSRKYDIRLRARDMKPDFAAIKRMFFLGLPASLEQSSRALSMSVITLLVAAYGTISLASYGLGIRMLTFIIIPAMGFAMASSTIAGQNLGAGKMDRVLKSTRVSMLLALGVLVVLGVLMFIFAPHIARAFVPTDETVVAEAAYFIRILAVSFGLIGVQQVVIGTFRAVGKTFLAMLITIVTLWVVNFPLAYILSRHTPLGVHGIYWSFTITNIIGTIIVLSVYYRGSWRTKADEDLKLREDVTKEAMVEEGIR